MKHLLILIFLLLFNSCNVTFKSSFFTPLSEIVFVLTDDFYVFHNYAWGELCLSGTKNPKNSELYSKDFVIIKKGTKLKKLGVLWLTKGPLIELETFTNFRKKRGIGIYEILNSKYEGKRLIYPSHGVPSYVLLKDYYHELRYTTNEKRNQQFKKLKKMYDRNPPKIKIISFGDYYRISLSEYITKVKTPFIQSERSKRIKISNKIGHLKRKGTLSTWSKYNY